MKLNPSAAGLAPITKFSVWEILVDHFEVNHEMTCPHYLAKRHPPEKLVEDFAYEFFDCPGITRDEYWQLVEHFKKHSGLVERISYSEVFSERDAIELLKSFSLTPDLKTREVNFRAVGLDPGQKFEVWRQDDNGNEFLVSEFQCSYLARLYRKRLERRGHKQHYWVKRLTCAKVQNPETRRLPGVSQSPET